ncbi:hypothetical protein WHR41_03206 [Cladosporium halotolerans]|uniref:Uncharacterized protein n=1 Tax=Cladosporium halotolerans TaxID=1052096 RepID=A0AB34KT34_9PEZI
MHWRRAGWIAEHAGRGENATRSGRTPSDVSSGSSTPADANHTEPSSMLMDLRYFLEMVDEKHRYGANLQVYHEYWQRQNTTENFFHWLDHGPGRHLDLPLCSREKLDREKIRYLSREERKDYLVQIDDQGRLRWDKNGELITTSVDEYKDSNHGIVPKSSPDPLSPAAADTVSPDARHALAHDLAAFSHLSLDSQESSSSTSSSSSSSPESSHPTSPSPDPKKKPHRSLRISPAALLNHLLRSSVKPGTWIYVTDTLNRLYVGIKNSGAFQHASFLSGARIRSAGAIGIQDGRLTYLSPLSGHYRPTTRSFRAFVDGLEESGVDLAALRVSGAYKVLKGMELYGRTKRGLRKAGGKGEKRGEKGKGSLGKEERVALEALHETEGISATELVERHWEEHHGRRGKGKG